VHAGWLRRHGADAQTFYQAPRDFRAEASVGTTTGKSSRNGNIVVMLRTRFMSLIERQLLSRP
jgi:hypothetical protein